jgi:hypothetical protein
MPAGGVIAGLADGARFIGRKERANHELPALDGGARKATVSVTASTKAIQDGQMAGLERFYGIHELPGAKLTIQSHRPIKHRVRFRRSSGMSASSSKKALGMAI